MTRFIPVYPKPLQSKASILRLFFSQRRSWLEGLYQRSYQMRMGEWHLPGIDLYMLNEPDLAKTALSTQARLFPKHELLAEALRPLLGNSIFTTNGELWRRQRAMMEPAFEVTRMDIAFPRMREAVESLLKRLDQRMPSSTMTSLDIEPEMTHVTADIIFRSIFSQPLDEKKAKELFTAFTNYQQLVPKLILPALFGLRWLKPWWLRSKAQRNANLIRCSIEELVANRLSEGQHGEPRDDILSALIQSRDPAGGESFTPTELVDQIAMLFLAGHETSASALSWALYLLANQPDIQEQLQQEISQAFGRNGKIDGRRLMKLELLRDVFRETLRLYPPVGFLARQAACPYQMGDKNIPTGAAVLISPWLLHRHQRFWHQPEQFDPMRYRNNSTESCPVGENDRRAYLPFGMGERICIGAAFALQEAALVLAELVRNFEMRPQPGHSPWPVGRLTIRPENGIHLHLIRRP